MTPSTRCRGTQTVAAWRSISSAKRLPRRHRLDADAVDPVAGALQYREYDVFARLLMRMMMRRGGHPTDIPHDYDYTDWDTIERFGQEFAALLPGRSRRRRRAREAPEPQRPDTGDAAKPQPPETGDRVSHHSHGVPT